MTTVAMPHVMPPERTEDFKEMVAAGSAAARRRPMKWRAWLVLAVLALIIVSRLRDQSASSHEKESVPFTRENYVINTETTGIGGARQVDFAQAAPSAAPAITAAAAPSPASNASLSVAPPRKARARIVTDPAAGWSTEPTEEVIGAKDLEGSPETPAKPVGTPRPLSVNVGSRFEVRLLNTIVTGAAPGVASAEVLSDIKNADGAVVVPKGSRLEGQAISTKETDRAQILFRAVVMEGRTVSVSAFVLGADGEMGLPAKVLKKGTKGRSVLGKALRVAAGAASMLPLVPNVNSFPEDLASSAASTAMSDLANTGAAWQAQWQASDKVLQVIAGTPASVYMASDLVLR